MNKYERCLWVVNTLYDYGDASLEELNKRWINSAFCYEKEDITPRTFARDKEFISSILQVDIEYNGRTRKYYLSNPQVIDENAIYKYLLGVFHISGISSLALQHKDKVMLQEIPTGTGILHIILDAIDKKRTVVFVYTSYYASKEKVYTYEVIPCFLRLFEQRWYLICEYLDRSQTRVLALERMADLKIGEQEIEASESINPTNFYSTCYGIIRDDKKPTEILLKVFDKEVDYIRSVPIHASQQEVETGQDYAIFSYYLRPSLDFTQRILWHRDRVEVLAPCSFREELKNLISSMLERYK